MAADLQRLDVGHHADANSVRSDSDGGTPPGVNWVEPRPGLIGRWNPGGGTPPEGGTPPGVNWELGEPGRGRTRGENPPGENRPG
jgi:hypothetical protein